MTGPPDDPQKDCTFCNPLHKGELADSLVLKFNGCYYAYGTPPHGEALPVLRSADLVDWEPVGTGIVVDRLVDMTRLAGERRTVMRPHAEWHLYGRDRRGTTGCGTGTPSKGPATGARAPSGCSR